MKKIGVAMLVLLVMAIAQPALAATLPVSISVIGSDGKVAANADYKIYYAGNGTLATSGTLSADGKASFNLTNSTEYLALIITTSDSILDNFTVPATLGANETAVNITINASALYALTVSSEPIQNIQVKLVPESYKNFTYSFNTNWTVYLDLRHNLTFPNETKSGFWTYALKSIKVDTSTYNNTTEVTIPMTGNTTVVAIYEFKFPVLEPIYVVLIIGLIGVALVAVVMLSGKKAKATARARVEDSFRFYRRIK